ncbi:facilitated trehalose transporter Tret1-like [Bombyx mandarina]|uniref:Facilitated trehalose transporter Tret1-like n=1 Tax=Bombyx mandarina TaxID=7092 RepID=A0A6J2KN86_BOMMA|nr:facilitated trehalose transporter Tret1-like [Bombyx mandarina]
MGVWVQAGSTALICCVCVNMAAMFMWPSSTLTLFQSGYTPLHRPLTEAEANMLGSLSSLGALISTPFTGMMLDRLGRKNISLLIGVIGVISWSMISLSNRVEVVLSAIFLSGLSGSVFLVVPVYISEICQTSIRGTMTSCSMVFYGVGMLVSYLMGGYMNYYPMVYTCLTMAVASTLFITVLKETPVCLMAKGLNEEAAKSLAFYRGLKPESKEVLEELSIIQRSLSPDLDCAEVTPEEQKLNPADRKHQKLSVIQFLNKSRSTRKALFVCVTILTLSIFQGSVVVQVYAGPLFSAAIPSVSSTLCSVVVAVVTVLTGLVSAYLTEVAGRRPLMIHSSTLSGLCCILLGTQIQLGWAPSWVTALFIFVFTATYSLGSGMVPYVLFAEVFLPEVKSFMSMLTVEWAWFCNYVILLIFNPLLKVVGLGPIFYIFAVICFVTSVFCMLEQPETKGLHCEDIQHLFDKKSSKARRIEGSA